MPETEKFVFESIYFEGDHWLGSSLLRARFSRCVFNEVDLRGCDWRECLFERCDLQSLTVDDVTRLNGCRFDEGSRVTGLLELNDDEDSMRRFVPNICEELLKKRGAIFEHVSETKLSFDLRPVRPDLRAALGRFFRIFNRNSGTTENTIKLKLGQQTNLFNKILMPVLLKHGVIRSTAFRGSGAQERYELAFPIDTILAAEDASGPAPAQLKSFWEALRSEKD